MEKWPLPEGWGWERIGEVVLETGRTNPRQNLDQAFTYIEISSIDSLTGKIVEPRVVVGRDAPSRARKVVTTNDVIFATTRPYLRNIALVQQEYDGQVCSTGFCVLRANPRTMIPQWLYHLCRSHIVLKKIEPLMHGATYPAITDSELLSVEIPVPPLDVQRRIVARVETLFAELAAARHTHAAFVYDAERLMDVALAEIFSELVERYGLKLLGEHQPFITSGPRYWSKYAKKRSNGPLFLRIGNIGYAQLDLDDIERLQLPEGLARKRARVQVDDVLITITGTIGRCAVVPEHLPEAYINQHTALVRLNQETILPRYLMWFVLSPLGSGQTESAAYGQTKPGLNLTQLRELKLPVPPLAVQRRIVAYLDAVQAHTAELQRTAAALAADLDRTEQAILAQAFKGEL